MNIWNIFEIDLESRPDFRGTKAEIIQRLIFDTGYRTTILYRFAQQLKKKRDMSRVFPVLGNLILARLSNSPGVEFRIREDVGRGLTIYHPHDIVIGAGCIVGENVTIYNGVTLGARRIGDVGKGEIEKRRYPIIEDNVVIFSGAKVLGAITIGQNSIIGANSVVLDSFPPNSIIAGIPARAVGEKNKDSSG